MSTPFRLRLRRTLNRFFMLSTRTFGRNTRMQIPPGLAAVRGSMFFLVLVTFCVTSATSSQSFRGLLNNLLPKRPAGGGGDISVKDPRTIPTKNKRFVYNGLYERLSTGRYSADCFTIEKRTRFLYIDIYSTDY